QNGIAGRAFRIGKLPRLAHAAPLVVQNTKVMNLVPNEGVKESVPSDDKGGAPAGQVFDGYWVHQRIVEQHQHRALEDVVRGVSRGRTGAFVVRDRGDLRDLVFIGEGDSPFAGGVLGLIENRDDSAQALARPFVIDLHLAGFDVIDLRYEGKGERIVKHALGQ